MKVVFLDFDGVLNSLDFLKSRGPRPNGMNLFSEEHARWSLNHEAVRRLNRLVDAGAVFVVSSTWRTFFPFERVQAFLNHAGFKGTVVGTTPHLPNSVRGIEIQKWLDDNKGVESFVILDDDDDMAHLSDRLVRTDDEVGLTEADVLRALEVLGLG